MALLTVKHFVALNVAQVAHVAYISEGEVGVEASLTCPVTYSLLYLLGRSGVGLGATAAFLVARVYGVLLITLCLLLQGTLLFSLGSLVWRHSQVLRHAFAVVGSFWLLASVALLPSLEVVVLALRALPAAIWKLEIFCTILLFV